MLNMQSDLLESKELSPETEERNWKGICIAFGVIASIFLLIIMAINILPDDDRNRVKLPRLTLEEVLSDNWRSSFRDASWISEVEVAHRNQHGNLEVFNCIDNSSYILLANTTFLREQVQDYSISSDRKYVLLVSGKKKIFSNSFLATYKVYNLSNEQIINLEIDEQDPQLQFAEWGPKGNQILLVYQNNLYYSPEVGKELAKVTRSASDTVYNAVTDWLYAQRILRTPQAVWWSPNGQRLAFATFNDTQVDSITYPKYGAFQDPLNIFTEMVSTRFPRAGRPNPTVTVWTVDITNPTVDYSPQRVSAPNEIVNSDHYLTALSWIDEERLAVVWMRREQNYSVVSLCTSYNNWMCNKHLEERLESESKDGWVDMLDTPLITHDKRHYLLILPLSEPENGAFRQIVMITINGRVKNFLTQGPQDVTKILGHHQETRTVFYAATSADGPGERHIFAIPDIYSSQPRNAHCITCNRTERNCSFNDATFNPTASLFILKCLGPGIPWTEVRNVADNSVLFQTLPDMKLKALVQERAFPQLRSFRVPISTDHSADVRLVLPPAWRQDEDSTNDPQQGHQHASKKFHIDFGLYLASNRSFVYAKIDVRGNRYRNERTMHDTHHRITSVQVEDLIRVVNHLRRHNNYIDSSRICIWGWSFGGYLAASVLAQSNIFNCCVSVAPIINWLYVDSFTAERYFGNPWISGNYARYQRADLSEKALYFRGRNLFILHGTADDAVHLQNSFALMKALNSKEVFYRTQLYPDSNHQLEDVRFHLYRSIELFFLECLLAVHDVPHHT